MLAASVGGVGTGEVVIEADDGIARDDAAGAETGEGSIPRSDSTDDD
jgi:hypothetical protein